MIVVVRDLFSLSRCFGFQLGDAQKREGVARVCRSTTVAPRSARARDPGEAIYLSIGTLTNCQLSLRCSTRSTVSAGKYHSCICLWPSDMDMESFLQL